MIATDLYKSSGHFFVAFVEDFISIDLHYHQLFLINLICVSELPLYILSN